MSINKNRFKGLSKKFFKLLMKWGPVPKDKFESEELFNEMVGDKDIKIESLVPHHLNINGVLIPEPCNICRIEYEEVMVGCFSVKNFLIPVIEKRKATIVGLPDEKENTIYIVSKIVKDTMKEQNIMRYDVFGVNMERNKNFRIKMATALTAVWRKI